MVDLKEVAEHSYLLAKIVLSVTSSISSMLFLAILIRILLWMAG